MSIKKDNEADKFTDMLPTRLTLLRRASDEFDDSVWGELLAYYKPYIRKILLRVGLRDEDLEDALQEVYIKLWRGLHLYKRDAENARFRSWLSTVVRNSSLNWIYKNRRRSDRELAVDNEIIEKIDSVEPPIDKIIEEEWQTYVLDLAMDNLKSVFSANAFEVLEMSLNGATPDEIAARVNIRKESVYVLRSKVKARLMKEIAFIRENLED